MQKFVDNHIILVTTPTPPYLHHENSPMLSHSSLYHFIVVISVCHWFVVMLPIGALQARKAVRLFNDAFINADQDRDEEVENLMH